MIIIGVDYHPSFQQISFMNQETGECGDRRLTLHHAMSGFFPEALEAKKSFIQRQLADNICECAKNLGIEARHVLCDDNTNCPQCGELAPITILPEGVCAVCWLGNLRN